MQWGGKVFSTHSEQDQTGVQVWAASLLLARRIIESRVLFAQKSVLELGAGCGVPGLAAALYTEASSVALTDIANLTLHNLRHNVALNFPEDVTTQVDEATSTGSAPETPPASSTETSTPFPSRVTVHALDWTETGETAPVDIILGSDLVYQEEVVPMLVKVTCDLLKPEGVAFFVARGEERDGLGAFQAQMQGAGFQMEMTTVAKRYYTNPLANGDDEECDKFFQLDPSHQYHFYKFHSRVIPEPGATLLKTRRRRKKKK
jgi:predicted nicotinamide N-methyase